MKTKVVTIGIPVYNGAEFISKTLDSILNQTYKNLEIIVSDNGSSDTTVEIVKEFMSIDKRIYLNQNKENLGYSGNLNKIIELANSEYIAIYHADDIYEPAIVEEQVKFLENNQELAGCFTLGKVIDDEGKLRKNIFNFNIKNNTIVDLDIFVKNMCEVGNMLVCPTSMIKKSVYEELKGYNISLKYIEDQDMWIRILEKYNLGIIAKELFNYRIHSNQGSGYYSSKERKELSVDLIYMREYLDKHIELKNKFELSLKRRIAIGYIILARNAVYLNDYNKFKLFIEKSKKSCCIKDNVRYRLIQEFGNKFVFNILKFKTR